MTTKGPKWPFLKLKFSDFFLPKLKNMILKTNCDICCSSDPIKIQTCLAPQNDCQNLSLVVGKK